MFSTRFDSDDVVQRLLILLQAFIVAVMAANARDALDSRSSAGFGAAYAGMRFILAAQYLRARTIRATRKLTTRFALGFGIAAVIWTLSALTEAPLRYWLWGLALLIDFLTPWLAERHGLKAPPHAEHFPERFGLFTIILLGEFAAEVMHGIASQEYWSMSAASTALSGMAFVFALWWWYFDCAGCTAERHVLSRRQQWVFQLWSYSHLPLFIGIGAAGVGFNHLIALQAGEHLHHEEGLILLFAIAVAMVALTTIGATSTTTGSGMQLAKRLWPQYAIAAAVLSFGGYSEHLHKAALAGVLLISCLGQAFLARREAPLTRLASQNAL